MSAAHTPKRRYTAPLDADRCEGTVTLRDKSTARCMHRRMRDPGARYCAQHGWPEAGRARAAIAAAEGK